MTNTFTCPFPQAPNNPDGAILPADTTTKKTIFTAGANGSILKDLGITSTDTSNRTVQLWINVGGAGTDRLLGSIVVTALAGTDGAILPIDVMRSTVFPFFEYDAFGNRVMYLKAGTTLKAASLVTVTAAKEIDFVGSGLDY